jgi:hypothetical protein
VFPTNVSPKSSALRRSIERALAAPPITADRTSAPRR